MRSGDPELYIRNRYSEYGLKSPDDLVSGFDQWYETDRTIQDASGLSETAKWLYDRITSGAYGVNPDALVDVLEQYVFEGRISEAEAVYLSSLV